MTVTEHDDPPFRGSLFIYVDGYSVDDFRCGELNLGHKFSQPEPDQMYWYLEGWAVGDNSRDRYCSRNAKDKIRHFKSYDDAVEYIQRKRKKRPKERFSLVYEVGNQARKISLLDEILAIDAEIEADENARKESHENHYPGFEILSQKVGRVVAFNAAELLGLLRNEGEEAAKARFSRATFYRLKGILKEAGLLADAS
jgi:hypothetical protein